MLDLARKCAIPLKKCNISQKCKITKKREKKNVKKNAGGKA